MLIRELKKVICSISFVLLLAALLAMAYSQDILDFSDRKLEEPQPGQSYGMRAKDVPELIMPAALDSLYSEFCANHYTAYPIGFYKSVRLTDQKQARMADVLAALTGRPVSEFAGMEGMQNGAPENNAFVLGEDSPMTAQGDGSFSIDLDDLPASSDPPAALALKEGISYEEFKAHMAEADRLIGGGSHYSETYLINFGQVPITYEEAMAQYELAKNADRFTGAYARLFCDYIGVGVLGVLPVFLAVALCLKDNRSHMEALIYTRRASSLRIVLTRYAAILLAVMLPTLALAYLSNASIWGLFEGASLNYLAPLTYSLGWLLPSVMVAAAVGMFFTELTGTPIAIAIQGLWWFFDINTGIAEIEGGYSLLRLAPRHNSLNGTQIFMDGFGALAANRLLFAGLALALVGATVFIYEQKRRGKHHGFKSFHAFAAAVGYRGGKSAA